MTDEKKLLEAVRNNQRQALIDIYDTYQAQIYAYAYRTMLQADLAEECVAATFHRLLEALQKGKGPSTHLRAYLYRIAHNWMMDWYRHADKELQQVDEQADRWEDPEPSPVEIVSQRQLGDELQAQLMQVTPDQREVLVLRFVEQYSLQETAMIVHKPLGAVKALQNRALTNLRKFYKQKDSEENERE
ncbi:MAG: RNA polymerase sigma factor [Anaerolineaceae bacterium]|nr:RNA polymerase sigma factor [Anaerolineaceae bacterium]